MFIHLTYIGVRPRVDVWQKYNLFLQTNQLLPLHLQYRYHATISMEVATFSQKSTP